MFPSTGLDFREPLRTEVLLISPMGVSNAGHLTVLKQGKLLVVL